MTASTSDLRKTRSPSPSNTRTTCVRSAVASDPTHGAVMPPMYLSSNYTFSGYDEKRQYDYTRSGNPTRDALGHAVAELEGGAGGIVTSSGMAALTTVFHLVKAGERIVAPHDCYGGTHRLLTALSRAGHFDVDFVDLTDETTRRAALAAAPRLVLIETPSNPLLRITDIAALCAEAGEHGTIVVADNTFLSPVLQQPLALGADIVLHSTTKYLNGHSDVVGGAVIAKDAALVDEVEWWANCLGCTGAPFDSYLTLRGLRTLHARMRHHCENAGAVAALLDAHPAVERVYFLGLASHPGHALAERQQAGHGGMVSFELARGEAAVRVFLEAIQHFCLAESLGGVESLVAHPATMTHAAMEPEARRTAGIADSLLRISAGIECPEDLCADLDQALDKTQVALDTDQVAVAQAG